MEKHMSAGCEGPCWQAQAQKKSSSHPGAPWAQRLTSSRAFSRSSLYRSTTCTASLIPPSENIAATSRSSAARASTDCSWASCSCAARAPASERCAASTSEA